MALTPSRTTAGTSDSLLVVNSNVSPGEGDFRTRKALLKNLTGTASVFLGGAGVTIGTGFQWDAADGPLEVELEPGEELHGIVAATPQTIHVLLGGR